MSLPFAAPHRLRTFLGLARKSGKLVVGREACRSARRRRTLTLLVIARDAGASAGRDAGADGKVPVLVAPFEKAELGACVGRSDVAVVGVTDVNLARGLLNGLADQD